MNHDAIADGQLRWVHSGSQGRDDARGLMSSDAVRLTTVTDPGTVVVQVAAAHSRRCHAQEHLTGHRLRLRELPKLNPSTAGEHHALHKITSAVVANSDRAIITKGSQLVVAEPKLLTEDAVRVGSQWRSPGGLDDG